MKTFERQRNIMRLFFLENPLGSWTRMDCSKGHVLCVKNHVSPTPQESQSVYLRGGHKICICSKLPSDAYAGL